MTDDSYAAGVREIEQLRAKLARLEAIAAATPPRAGMHDAIADHYSPTQAPVDPARARLEAIARGFVADPQSEAAVAARKANPERFDADYRAMHGDALALGLYSRQRDAAIATATWTPPTPDEGDAS